MTTIVLRADSLGALTWDEVDANFDNLNNDKIETGFGVVQTGPTGAAVVPAGSTGFRPISPVEGYFRYNTTTSTFEGYSGGTWGEIGGGGGGATGGGTDQVFVENDVTVTTDYTLSTGKNAHSVGPITINSGITVTVPTGQIWQVS
jgi:hypothetical protein